jgi:hypothetical protein
MRIVVLQNNTSKSSPSSSTTTVLPPSIKMEKADEHQVSSVSVVNGIL